MGTYPSIKAKAYIFEEDKLIKDNFFIHAESGLAAVISNDPLNKTIQYKSPEEYILLLSTGLEDKVGEQIFDCDILYSVETGIYSLVRFGDTFELMEGDGYYGWFLEHLNVDDTKYKYSQLNESVHLTSCIVGNKYTTPHFLNNSY